MNAQAPRDSNPCLNCNTEVDAESRFCSHCGQSVKDSKLSVVKIVKDALSDFFNLDSRFAHTIKDILWPSKLTKAYIGGQRKKYMNPARLFIFSLIAFISILLMDLDFQRASFFGEHIIEDVTLVKSKKRFESISKGIGMDEEQVKMLSDTVYGKLDADSLYLGQGMEMSLVGCEIRDFNIKKEDALNMTSSELLEAYEIKGFWPRLFVKQYHKLTFNSGGGLTYIIKNLTWVILIELFLMALFMKVFYPFRGYYYVEHLVLLLYSHALLFLTVSLFLAVIYVVGSKALANFFIVIGIVGVHIVQYLSLKKYYQQGVFMTLLKMVMINLTYLISSIMVFAIGALLSFSLF